MDIAFSKLCEEIKFNANKNWEKMFLISANLKKNKVFHIIFQSDYFIPVNEMKKFLEKLSLNFKYKSKPEFSTTRKTFNKTIIIDYIVWIVDEILNEKEFANYIKKTECETDVKGDIFFSPMSKFYIKKYKKIENKLLSILKTFGFRDLEIKIKESINILKNQNIQEIEVANIINKRISKNNNYQWSKENKKQNNYISASIEEIRSSGEEYIEEYIETFGEIFVKNSFLTKSKIKILSLEITDHKEALSLTKFLKDEKDILYFDSLKIGDKVIVRGIVTNNKYKNDICLNIKQIKKKKIILKKNENSKQTKRVELNTKTNMSVMDGIATPENYYKKAKELNHTALAIIDIDNVQSFPIFEKITKKDSSFKAIYGTSIRVVDNNKRIISKKSNKKIIDNKYIVFDLETTGFNAKYNGLIEFAGCKVINGKIVETKQFLINCNKKISAKIEELTKISNEDIKNSITEKQAMEKIIDYFDDYFLVAHNAKFDMSFIYKKIEKYNLKKINNCVIDTLPLSREMFSKGKKHTLEAFATRNNVEYDREVAHRADYDAEVLANSWISTMNKLNEKNIKNTKDLWLLNFTKNSFKDRGKRITLIAQNNIGLKNIFKLTSIAHIKNFNGNTKVTIEDIEKYREGILVGSPGVAGFAWEFELKKTQKELENEISFYDFIEVNPIENYTHLINREEICLIDVREAIKNIIETSKKLEKLVVATSASRYINKDDKFIHQIYIESKGIGGVPHELFKYREKNPKYPSFHFRDTDSMKSEFDFLNNDKLIEEIVVTNTNKIAGFIGEVQIKKDELFTPKIKKSKENLINLTYKKAKEIYGKILPSIVEKRIKKELKTIINNGYDVIYWIAHILVQKSLNEGYLVGSRGSVGSSLVATLTGITEVNPLSPHYYCLKCQYSEFTKNLTLKSGYDLPQKNCEKCKTELERDGHSIPFETFLGFNGEKIPDIDLNFSGEYQKTIHNEVRKIFGEDFCFRAGTISTIAQRTAFGYVKAWMEEKNIEFSRSYINYLTIKLSGTKRTTGQHPGGIIIVPEEYSIEDFTPINFPANDANSSWKTTHFDFNAIHDNLLKLDLLGHDDPTAIKMLQKLTGIKPKNIPNTDPKVLKLFKNTKSLDITPNDISGETTGAMGIPEFGTPFVRKILKSVNVNSFSDLISISGLSHGTGVWIENAQRDVKYKGITIDEIISCRDDILNDLTKYGVNNKDAFVIMEQVRKGKSINIIQEKLMRDKKVPDWYIESCKKIKYMFPKAHATAYVKMAWRVAWFKVYYPLPYYATYFSIRAKATDINKMLISKERIHETLKELKKNMNSRNLKNKITNKEKDLIPVLELCEELHARGYKILPINIDISKATEWIIDYENNALIPPFNSIDGLGDIIANTIVVERKKQFFSSIEDFKKRTSINKTSIQQLREINSLSNIPERNQLSLFD